MSRYLGHDRVEVGVREPVALDVRQEPAEGRRVRDVQGIRLTATPSEEAADSAIIEPESLGAEKTRDLS
jgi:hypothetical protein